MSSAKFTPKEVVDALHNSKGMVYVAARQLNCAANTIYNYAKRYPQVQAALTHERGMMIDVAEIALWKAIQNGEGWAISLALKTIGRERGYTERVEHVVFDMESLKRFEQLAKQLGKPLPALFEDMVNVLGSELSDGVKAGGAAANAEND